MLKNIDKILIKALGFLKDHRGISMFLYLLGAFVSACYTYFARSGQNEVMTFTVLGVELAFLTLAFTLVWDFGKVLLWVLWIRKRKIGFLIVWLFVMAYSILFTTGAFVSSENKEINITNNSNSKYELVMDNRQKLINQIETKTDSLKSLESEKQNIASSLSLQENNNKIKFEKYNNELNYLNAALSEKQATWQSYQNKGWIEKRNAVGKDIDELKNRINLTMQSMNGLKLNDNSAEIQSRIDKLQTEINNLNNKLLNIDIDDSLPKSVSENTLVPLYAKLSDNVESFSLKFNALLSLLFELLLCFLYDVANGGSGNPVESLKPKKNILKAIKNIKPKEIFKMKRDNQTVTNKTESNNNNSKMESGFCEFEPYQEEIKLDSTPRKIGFTLEKNTPKKPKFKLTPRKFTPKNPKLKNSESSINTLSPIEPKKTEPTKFKISKLNLPKTAKFTNEELTQYFNYMIKSKKHGNVSLGYAKISKEIGLTADKGRKIKGYLETIGIIESKDKTTYILKNKLD